MSWVFPPLHVESGLKARVAQGLPPMGPESVCRTCGCRCSSRSDCASSPPAPAGGIVTASEQLREEAIYIPPHFTEKNTEVHRGEVDQLERAQPRHKPRTVLPSTLAFLCLVFCVSLWVSVAPDKAWVW